jgi:hypothetical protein
MFKTTFKTLLVALALIVPYSMQANEAEKTNIPAHQANSEALTLLATMNMKQSYEGMIKRITQMQIQSNPKLKDIEPVIESFFTKYMGWEAQRGDIAALYAKNYTAEELKELNKFYQTPLGQKTVQIMPQLAAAAAQIGQSRMMKHMPEMKTMIDSELKKVISTK